jgi:DNA-binding CsgD family transcriptional regulator
MRKDCRLVVPLGQLPQPWIVTWLVREQVRGADQPRTPPVVYIVAARARAALAGRDQGPPSACVRTRAGQWLVVHGSLLAGSDGPDGRAAVVIEPARPAEIAPVIVAAYQLTERERDVLRLVCRGLGTEEIAQALFLSPHTVRGHLKALFAKVGVASRGELVARLFADHYHGQLAGTTSTMLDSA